MYNIAICDDNEEDIKKLESIIWECNRTEKEIRFLEYPSGEMLLDNLPEELDSLFLDIHMPGINGNQAAAELRRRNFQGVLVQCSGSFLPTTETIKLAPYRFILKYNARDQIAEDVCDVLEAMAEKKACFTLEASYRREKIIFNAEDIVYITHHQKGSELHLRKEKQDCFMEGKIITSMKFDDLMERLGTEGFAIPHNSYIVNMEYIRDFDYRKEIIQIEGEIFSVSRSWKGDFYKKLREYMGERKRKKLSF